MTATRQLGGLLLLLGVLSVAGARDADLIGYGQLTIDRWKRLLPYMGHCDCGSFNKDFPVRYYDRRVSMESVDEILCAPNYQKYVRLRKK